jgi:SSS family transporter
MNFRLPAPVAYGASTSVPAGIVCAGGESAAGITRNVFLMQWNAAEKKVQYQPLPQLPLPLTNAAAASYGNTIYLAGGSDGKEAAAKFFAFNLDDPSPHWMTLPGLPNGVSHAAIAVQSNGEAPCVYIMGGRRSSASGPSHLYNQVFKFDIRKNTWEACQPIGDSTGLVSLSAATAVAAGANYILLIGGDDGRLFNELETLEFRIRNAADAAQKAALQQNKLNILDDHPGFNREIWLYNTITDVWTRTSTLNLPAPATTTAVKWGKDILVPSGEVRPGVRTPAVLQGTIPDQQFFSWIDTIVLIICFLLMTLGRYWFTGHANNTLDYFKGGQHIPQWAAAVSIFGAKLSAITFMGIPAKTYATNWTYLFYLLAIPMIMPFVARFFIPFYRRLNVTSAYEYLSRRFNMGTRMIASTLFILLQLGRMGIVVLLPSIALTLVTGINIYLCILLIGAISIFFTVKGGIEAVIWVEVIQVLILAAGALLCLFYIPFQINDWHGGMQAIKEAEKLKVFDFRFNFSEPTLWVVLIGGLAIQFLTYGTDQTTVQRYLVTKTQKEAVKSLRLGAWMTVPSTLAFFSIGTLLFLFFREHPEKVNVALENQDNIFPWYIVSQLPAGISGLLIAGIFSASMSSTEASMNSTATLLTMDFCKRWRPDINDRQTLRFARITTFILGIFVTGISLYMAHEGVSSLWDKFNTILGLFTGCIGGAYLLGIFTKRANGKGVIGGMLASCLIQLWIQQYTSIHLLMYAFTGLVACVVTGYLFSLVLQDEQKDIIGLTVYKK